MVLAKFPNEFAMRHDVVALTLLLASAALAPASALDCRKPAAGIAKVICSTPDAKASEARMASAHGALSVSIDDGQRDALVKDQRDWTARRDATCLARPATAGSCVVGLDDARTRVLAGSPVTGSATGGRLTPVFRGMEGNESTLTWRASLVRFAQPESPQEKAFNAFVEGRLNHVPKNVGIDIGVSGFHIQTGSVASASPDLVSVRVDGTEFVPQDGGSFSWTENINWDMRRGGPVTVRSTFTKEGFATFRQTCLDQVADQLTASRKSDGHEALPESEEAAFMRVKMRESRGDVDAITTDPAHWQFDPDALVVTYDGRSVDRHVAEPYTCHVGYDALRALARPDATIPPAR